MVMFLEWLTKELELDIDLDELDAAASENATIQNRQTAAAQDT